MQRIKTLRVKTLLMLPIISLSLIGCNEFESVNSASGAGGLGLVPPGEVGLPGAPEGAVDMEALNKELDELEIALVNVESEVAKIDIPYLVAGGNNSQSLTKGIKKLFDKLYDAVVRVTSKTDDLRAEINARMSKLDPMNPLHMLAIIKLREALAYIDQLDARVSASMDRVVLKLNEMLAKVEAKVADMDQSNPLTWFAIVYWEQIKVVVNEFRDKVDAL